MRGRGSRVAAVALTALGACEPSTPPRGQLVLYVTTDALLPPPAGEPLDLGAPPPLFDRVRVDVFLPGEDAPCEGCSREFEVDRVLVDGGRASVGLVTVEGRSGYRARVRMLRGGAERDGEPAEDSTIDVTVALPPVIPDTITEVTVVLRTDDVGTPRGLDAPLAPIVGPPAPGLVGTWPGAARVPCAAPPPPGYVCVPGGAYWMGNPLVEGVSSIEPQDGRQRLVVLSPFFVQATEVLVEDFMAANPELDFSRRPTFCTSKGTLPVNCISWEGAREHCRRIGADLPTEAQYEYAASGLRGDLYVWGKDEPTCADATFARGVEGQLCEKLGGDVTAPGTGARDRLTPAGDAREIVDLAGNLSEWTLDDWEPNGQGCWRAGVLRDPLCRSDSGLRTYRGGNLLHEPGQLRAAIRVSGTATGSIDLGFRCVRPAVP